MTPHTELWLNEWIRSDGHLTVSALFERPDGARSELWYRLPAEHESNITPSADPFVAGLLFDTMHTGGRLRVHADVSPSLLGNLEEFQAAWVKWRPNLYRPVEIVADRECETTPVETTAAVSTFSAGLDSCFTAWRHHTGLTERQQRDLRAGIFVHGLDIPLNMEADYRTAAEQAERLLAVLGMDCIRIATNFRELRGHWEDTHGAALASCLMLLQGGFRFGLIASSYAYSCLEFPYGSNPLTDGMFSSDAFGIVHDGAGFTRLEKTRVVAQWPDIAKYLRVCWKGPDYDRNCCRCQKCIRNILYFRMAGLRSMECFPHELSNREIIWAAYPNPADIEDTQNILHAARAEHITESWVRALQISIWLNRWRRRTPGSLRILGRTLRRSLDKRGNQPPAPLTHETAPDNEERTPLPNDGFVLDAPPHEMDGCRDLETLGRANRCR